MMIHNKYEIGQFVYLITDTDKLRRVVRSIQIHPAGAISYHLICGERDGWHSEFEISEEKNGNVAGFKKQAS